MSNDGCQNSILVTNNNRISLAVTQQTVCCVLLFSIPEASVRASQVRQATELVGESHPFTAWRYGADTNSQDTRKEDSPKSGMSQFSRVTRPRSAN